VSALKPLSCCRKFSKGTILPTTATTQGQAMKKNNPLWYQVTLADDRTGFAYSCVIKVIGIALQFNVARANNQPLSC